jgi:hypothetical protein
MSVSCGGAVRSASRARPTTPGHRDRRWLVSNSSFSSQDPDQCPVRTKSQPSPRPVCSRHRKEGGWPGRSLPRCFAHRFSGLDWHTVSAHCRSRYGGLMEGPRLSCRAMSSAGAGIRQSRRRQFAGMSKAVELADAERPRRTATIRRASAVNNSETTRSLFHSR